MPKSAKNVRKRKTAAGAVKPRSNARVQRYRDKMRAAGFKPVTIWVPDPNRPGFAEEVRRQCLLLKGDPQEAQILTEIEALTDFDDWK
jgi:Protein  of unknown function (DUF3018)